MRESHAEDLQREREAKEQAIAAAEERLAEIEAHAEAAERAGRGRPSGAPSEAEGKSPTRRPGPATPPRPGCASSSTTIRREAARAIAAVAEFDVAVVGGGAAGLWTALRAAEHGGRVCLDLPHPALAERQLLGPGRPGRGARTGRHPRPPRRRHDRRRPRPLPARGGPGAGRGGAGGGPRAAGARRRLRPRPRGTAGAGARGRPRQPPHRPLRRQPDRPRDHLEAGGDGRRRGADRGPASGPRRWRSGATASAAMAWSPTPARSPPPATVLATGGAAALWRRTTNPCGRDRRRPGARRGRRRRPRRPRVLPVPPDRALAARHAARRRC